MLLFSTERWQTQPCMINGGYGLWWTVDAQLRNLLKLHTLHSYLRVLPRYSTTVHTRLGRLKKKNIEIVLFGTHIILCNE